MVDIILFVSFKLLLLVVMFTIFLFILLPIVMAFFGIENKLCRNIVSGIFLFPTLAGCILGFRLLHAIHVTEDFTQSFDKFKTGTIRPEKVLLSTDVVRFKLNSWRPPKHFYVDIEDVATHKEYNSVYVSKHCNIKDLKLGDEYNIKVNRYYMSDNKTVILQEFTDLRSVFCD